MILVLLLGMLLEDLGEADFQVISTHQLAQEQM